jgi:Leucine-rich repeat (LRR) protein
MPVLDVALALKLGGGGCGDKNGGGVEGTSKITVLNLKEKGVSAVDASLVGACTSLTKLDLSDNVVGDVDSITALSQLASLKWLSLANNNLASAALAILGGGCGGGAGKKGAAAPAGAAGGLLTSMRVLNVSGNRLDSLRGVQGMTNLGALIANENAVESLEPCRGMAQLNTIVASSNQARVGTSPRSPPRYFAL